MNTVAVILLNIVMMILLIIIIVYLFIFDKRCIAKINSTSPIHREIIQQEMPGYVYDEMSSIKSDLNSLLIQQDQIRNIVEKTQNIIS
jgi:hypothetical protein